MAADKLVDSTQLDADLTSVANAIRTAGGTSASLAFPAGFVTAIGNISGGGGGGGELPDTYREVDYISTGTSGGPYIKTNYTPVQGDEFHILFQTNFSQTTTSTTSTFYCLLSAGTGTYQLICLIAANKVATSRSIYWKYLATGTASTTAKEFDQNAWYIATTSSGTLTAGNTSVTSAYGGAIDGTDKALYIGMRANGTTPFLGKFGRFQITNSGTLKLNLIPCYRISDTVIGMYDTVSNTFYTNAGSGSFTKGVDIL